MPGSSGSSSPDHGLGPGRRRTRPPPSGQPGQQLPASRPGAAGGRGQSAAVSSSPRRRSTVLCSFQHDSMTTDRRSPAPSPGGPGEVYFERGRSALGTGGIGARETARSLFNEAVRAAGSPMLWRVAEATVDTPTQAAHWMSRAGRVRANPAASPSNRRTARRASTGSGCPPRRTEPSGQPPALRRPPPDSRRSRAPAAPAQRFQCLLQTGLRRGTVAPRTGAVRVIGSSEN